MKLVPLTILTLAGVLTVLPLHAETCSEITAQDLNSRIESGLTLAETSNSIDAAGQNKISDLREDFSKAGDLQTQALDSGDLTKMNEACQTYKDILRQIEKLNN